jgi:hypothetical protein
MGAAEPGADQAADGNSDVKGAMKNGIEYVMQRGRQGLGATGGLDELQSQAEASAEALAGLRQALDQLAQGNYATQRGNTAAIAGATSQLGGNGTGNVYGDEVTQANDAKTKIVGIEQEKVAQVKLLNQEQRQSNADLYNELEVVGENAERNFASGLSRTFIAIVDGSKTAEQAFEAFAKSFLEQIAQMIMQTLILNALKSVSLFGNGGQVMAGGGGATGDANGGMHLAAAGVMLAAAGMQGVAEVNSATYLPRFNVLAGEAGREILTVMARPQLTSVDGAPVMLGDVSPEKLALLSQQSLSRMIQGAGRTALAAGGVISGGGGIPPATGLGLSGAGGKLDITVRLEAGLKAEIVQQSVEGARIQVATDLQTDSPIRSGVKGVLA